MNVTEFILKVLDLSLTGFLILMICRVLMQFLPLFIGSQNNQAVAMTGMAQSGAAIAQATERIHSTAEVFASNAQQYHATMQAALDFMQSSQQSNMSDHQKLIIMMRATAQKLDCLPCAGGMKRNPDCPGEKNEARPTRKSARAKVDSGSNPGLPGKERSAKIERGDALATA